MLNQKYHIATHRSAAPTISGKSSSLTIAAAFGVSALTLAAASAACTAIIVATSATLSTAQPI